MSSTGDNPYAPIEDTSIKAIYPIGSVIFCSEPLGGKYVWENVNSMDELTVEWQGCTWLFLTTNYQYYEQDHETHYWKGGTQVHTIRNYRVDLIKPPLPLTGAPFTAILRNPNDEENWDSNVPPTIGGYSGENKHWLTKEEMPVHSHDVTWRGYWSIHEGEGVEKNCRSDTWLDTDPERNITCGNAGGLNGKTQGHNNMEKALHILMYKRIA